ncbi:hypothetical protein M1523_02675 [Patescibacteria group bacterium]|nr:hypothetical protein [Patescibacteria group bacterium]MCL5091374.1 hypothetical protein [Patescibacteria group bacterium]
MIVSYSVPTRVWLSGAPGWIYGKPVLAAAVDFRLSLTVRDSDVAAGNQAVALVVDCVRQYLKQQRIKFDDRRFSYQIKSMAPVDRRLGSTTARRVTAVAALLEFFGRKPFPPEVINQLAYQCEKRTDNRASGIDSSTLCFGGLLYCRKEFGFLKTISRLNLKMPRSIADRLYLVDSGMAQETPVQMATELGKLYNRVPRLTEQRLNQMEKLTKKTIVALATDQPALFSRCLQEEETMFERLGLVSRSAKAMLHTLRSWGTGKISGSGGRRSGSGFLLFLAKDGKPLEAACRARRWPCYRLRQSDTGLRKESVQL